MSKKTCLHACYADIERLKSGLMCTFSVSSQESYVQEALARQLAASVSGPVFPGLHHVPLYASTPSPTMPQLTQLSGAKDTSSMPISNEDSQNYVQHLQSESLTITHHLVSTSKLNSDYLANHFISAVNIFYQTCNY